MGYYLEIGEEDYSYTYNVSAMWYDCFPHKGIRIIYGLTGQEALLKLRAIRTHMEDHAERLKELEPANGWGSFYGALGFINKLIVASMEHPHETWAGD